MIGVNFEGLDYVYNCLPFGLRTSAYALAKLTAVTAEVLRISGLASGFVCRLRSRYLLVAIRDAARDQDYNRVEPISGRDLEELRL